MQVRNVDGHFPSRFEHVACNGLVVSAFLTLFQRKAWRQTFSIGNFIITSALK